MAYRDLDAGFAGELCELELPEPDAVAVRAASIGGDEEALGVGVGVRADEIPPAPDRLDGKGCGVATVADRHEALVRPEVVDAVGNGLRHLFVGEVVGGDALRFACWFPGLPSVLQVSDDLLFLRVDADHGLAGAQVLHDLCVQMDELGVTVGVLRALVLLGIGLQAVAHLVQELADGDVADRISLAGELARECSGRLGRPSERAHGVAPALRLDELVEGQQQAGLGVDRLRPARTGTSHASCHLDAGVDLRNGPLHRAAAHGCGLGHGGDAATTDKTGDRASQETALALIEMREHGPEEHLQAVVADGELPHVRTLHLRELYRAAYSLPSPRC